MNHMSNDRKREFRESSKNEGVHEFQGIQKQRESWESTSFRNAIPGSHPKTREKRVRVPVDFVGGGGGGGETKKSIILKTTELVEWGPPLLFPYEKW